MSELAKTLDHQTRCRRDWYDNPDHFYVSPGGVDTRPGVGSDLGTAERPMTMDSFELTHFPLELILVDEKMISESRRIDDHNSMIDILCANPDFIAMLKAIATMAEKERKTGSASTSCIFS